MFKNSSLKKILIIQLILLIIFIVASYIFSLKINNFYKSEVINNNGYIISNILKDHPQLEESIIKSIISNKENKTFGLEILNKYGIKEDTLNQLPDIKRVNNKIILINIILILFSFSTLTIIYILFLKKEYKKIEKINEYMNNILNDNYSLDIREYEEGVISTLKSDIFKLTIKLKNMSEISMNDKIYLESILSDISHQIKTPLTSMNVINDVLTNDNIDPKLKKEFLNKNRNQIKRIEWLVTSLLKMSRLDSGSVILKKDKIKAIDLINKSLEPILIPIELKNIKLSIHTADNIYFNCDINWTSEALMNIIKNAYEHTLSGGEIKVEASDNPIYTEIKISDTGTGIKKEDINHIFERFYKSSSKSDSIGIGLNMAKKIINLQCGVIEVVSDENIGTTFIIKFYKSVV